MNITQIVDKIPKEADINPAEYTVADRIVDINQKYLELIERAVQIGSTEPPSDEEVFSEDFTLTVGSNELARTIIDIPIVRVDFQPNSGGDFERVYDDPTRSINGWWGCEMKFFADEKRIFVEEGKVGTLRVTYARGDVTTFIVSDYDSYDPPSPDWLPETFHALLWIAPAYTMAAYYKTDREKFLELKLARLEQLFITHYSRNSAINQRFETKNEGWLKRDNHR